MKISISSSISNFRDKLLKRTGFQEYNPKKDKYENCLFVGLYHSKDFRKFIFHRGKKEVFWCGSDCLINIHRNSIIPWKLLLRFPKARHICENEIEQKALLEIGIKAEIYPSFFDNPEDFPISFEPSDFPHVFLTCHGGKEPEFAARQSGLDIIEKIASKIPEITFHIYGRKKPFHQVWQDFTDYGFSGSSKVPTGRIYNLEYATNPNVIYHGEVSNEIFNKEIRNYHAAIRLHKLNGFGETIAKSILLGQYPISRIPYPHISYAPDEETFISLLRNLKYKREPNPNRDYWYNLLKNFPSW